VRIKKLEEAGLIRGYEARVAPEGLDLGLLAFVSVVTDEMPGSIDTAKALAAIPEVQEVHHVAGEDCFLIKVRAANNAAFASLLRERIGRIPHVRSTRTTIVLETVKETAKLPLRDERPKRRRKRR
jgi:Lrp/AsnC family leucine-responsive transcriptional regulator